MSEPQRLSHREGPSTHIPGVVPERVTVSINHIPNTEHPAYAYREIRWQYTQESGGGPPTRGSLQVRSCARNWDPNERVQFEISLDDGHSSSFGAVALNQEEARLFAEAILNQLPEKAG